MKKILALVLALTMSLTLGVTALAAPLPAEDALANLVFDEDDGDELILYYYAIADSAGDKLTTGPAHPDSDDPTNNDAIKSGSKLYLLSLIHIYFQTVWRDAQAAALPPRSPGRRCGPGKSASSFPPPARAGSDIGLS